VVCGPRWRNCERRDQERQRGRLPLSEGWWRKRKTDVSDGGVYNMSRSRWRVGSGRLPENEPAPYFGHPISTRGPRGHSRRRLSVCHVDERTQEDGQDAFPSSLLIHRSEEFVSLE
ncbi:hypothetical protein KUCAC02_034013, partial [Chaenocephalus aceratus]